MTDYQSLTKSMMNSNSSSLLNFSDEILLQILHRLQTEDVINISHTCTQLDRLVKDRTLCENLEFPWNIHVQRLSLVKFLRNPQRLNLINILNLYDLYWIPSGTIRDIIIKLPLLKSFFAAGTQLSWPHLHQFLKLNSSDNLIHLGWSWDNFIENAPDTPGNRKDVFAFMEQVKQVQPQLARLQSLVIHAPGVPTSRDAVFPGQYSTLPLMISACKGLEQLYIFSWPTVVQDAEFRQSSHHTSELFVDDPSFPNLKSFVLNEHERHNINIPRLVDKIVANLSGVGTNQKKPVKKFSMDHDFAGFHFERGMNHIDLSTVEQLSLPLMNEGRRFDNMNLENCKSLQLTHGCSSVAASVNLTGAFDTAVNLETFCSKARNYILNWEDFINKHPMIREINVSQDYSLPYPAYCIAIAQLKNLKKVSLPETCLLQIKDKRIVEKFNQQKLERNIPVEEPEPLQNWEQSEPGPSSGTRRRIAHTKSNSKCNSKGERILCGLDFLTSFCPEIDELELGFSKKSTRLQPSDWVVESLSSISNFKQLTKLTLDKIYFRNGSFLVDISKSCKLTSLRLSNLGLRAKCSYMADLCISLQNMSELKDFRLEQNNIGSSTQLMSALESCKKLERMVILSLINDKSLDAQRLEKLMKVCLRLTAVFIVIDKTSKILCTTTRLKLQTLYKLSRPPLSIIILNSMDESTRLSYPCVHNRKFVQLDPHVCAQMDFPKF